MYYQRYTENFIIIVILTIIYYIIYLMFFNKNMIALSDNEIDIYLESMSEF